MYGTKRETFIHKCVCMCVRVCVYWGGGGGGGGGVKTIIKEGYTNTI